MVATKSKKTTTKKVTKYDEKSSLLLGKKALETRMQHNAAKHARHKKRLETAVFLWAPLFAGWMAAQMSDNVSDAVNENTTLEITLGIYGLVAFVAALLAITLEPFYSKKEDAAAFEAEISKLLKSKLVDKAVNRELVRLAPVFKKITSQIAAKKPAIAKSLMNGDVDAFNADIVADAVREYLMKHPDDAREFVNLFTVAGVRQTVIDFYIATYVPDTLSFNMARQMMYNGKGKGE